MPSVDFEARATMSGTVVNWKLCHIDPPKPDNCGTTKSPFADVALGANQGHYIINFKIVQPPGLGLKFSSDPIWIQQGSQPTGPIIDPQIKILPSSTATLLKIKDENDKPNSANPDPVVLKYQLNFLDKNNNEVTSIDPDITNGGTNNRTESSAATADFPGPTSPEFWGLAALIFAASFAALAAARMLKFWR